MKSLTFIAFGLWGAWHLTDLQAESAFNAVFAPVLVFIFLIALIIWLLLKVDSLRARSSSPGGGVYGGSDGGSCNDGGGGGGGGCD